MESGNYPPGTEFDSKSPWNQTFLPDEEIEVTVSVTLSKTVKIKVNDYKVIDENNLDFSTCCLNEAVEEQIVLPQNLAVFTERLFNYDLGLKEVGMPRYLEEAIKDCKDWNVDELEVIAE